jgi:integrase/recombinase XerD
MPPATYTLVLRPARESDGLHPVALRITKSREAKFASTGILLAEKQWNPKAEFTKANWVRSSHREHALYNKTLSDLLDKARELALKNPDLSAAQLRDRVAGKATADNPAELDFLEFFGRDLARHESAGNPRTAKKRRTILRKLTAHTEATTGAPARLPFRQLTVSWIKEYQAWLTTANSNGVHTANKELQVIHTVLKQAVADGLLEFHKDPFLHVRLKHPKTQKARLTIEEVAQLEAYPTKPGWETFARDCWLLQFHCQGTRVGDILEMRHRDIGPERLTYLERKTGKRKNIPRHARLNELLARYPLAPDADPASFLLPLLDYRQPYAQSPEAATSVAQAQERLGTLLLAVEKYTALVNRYIKIVAKKAGIEKHITSHSARHSFADAARVQLGGNIKAIQQMLNHGQLRTTEIYLSELATTELDEATLSVYNTSTTKPEAPLSSEFQSSQDAA